MHEIGKHIRQLRLQKNMTQDDLALRIHTTRQTVSNYETGRSQPDINTLRLLAQALECDLSLLLEGEERPLPHKGLRQHLCPGYLRWSILMFALGAALCFTEPN